MAVYSELSENQLEKLLARAKAMCPMQTFKNYSEAPEISAPPTRKLPRTRTPQRRPAPKRSVAAPIANEIAYPEWIEQVKAFLRSIAAALSCALNAQAQPLWHSCASELSCLQVTQFASKRRSKNSS